MKRLKRFKELAIAAWQQLNNKKIAASEKSKDIKVFNNFVNILIVIIYIFFGTFGLISISLLTARVIF